MNKKNNSNINDIDIVDLFSSLWINKNFILKITLFFFLVSILYSLSLNNTYKASSTFYPHYEKTDNSNSLRNLAGLAGINLESESSGNIPSNLYPKIINSPIFKEKILNKNIFIGKNQMTYRKYLNNNSSSYNIKNVLFYPINFIKNLFLNNNINNKSSANTNVDILKFSDDEYNTHKYLDELILINLNEKEGFIEINVEDVNPYVASQIATFSEKILQESIIDFKIKNINETFKFTNEQFEIAKNNFYILQDSLARFKDKNRNIKSDLFSIQLKRLEFEVNMSKNIYNELALNKEKIAIEVQKNTPIFTIINPVVVPNKKSYPNRSLIVLYLTFFSFIITSFWVIIKKPLLNIISNIKN